MSYKMDFGDRCMILHEGCENPTVYWFPGEKGAKVWVEVDPRDVGICDEECIIFRIGEMYGCYPEEKEGYCSRAFKPRGYDTAQELCMVG